MRKELVELGRQIHNVDARLDFTEQLLGGALTLAPPPSRLALLEEEPEAEGSDGEGNSGQSACGASASISLPDGVVNA
jgi:hypothetical protein